MHNIDRDLEELDLGPSTIKFGTIKSIIGDVPISWRTVCLLPSSEGKISGKIENSALTQRCPFGAFAGIVVTLVPRFRTRPLPITYKTKHTTGPVAG